MSLRIYLDAHWQDASSGCAWALLDNAGNILESGNGSLASMPQSEEAAVIVASECVLSTSAALPDIKRGQLESALPFALDDVLIEDATETHVMPGDRLPNGHTALYAVSRNFLTRFLAVCASSRIRVRRLVPEFCLMPANIDEWSLAWDGTRGFLAMPHHLGIALDCGNEAHVPVALQLRLAQEAPARLRIFSLHDDVPVPDWKIEANVIFDRQPFDWRNCAIPDDAPNLLWGKFAPPPRIRELWPWLRPALMAALLLLGMEAVMSNFEWALFAHEKHQLQQDINNTFREAFGADATIVDAPLQMRRDVARLRHAAGVPDDADFSPMLDRFSLASSGLPGYRLHTLHYDNGRLNIALTVSNAAELDTLLQRITDTGLSAHVDDRHVSANTLDVQLRLSEPEQAL